MLSWFLCSLSDSDLIAFFLPWKNNCVIFIYWVVPAFPAVSSAMSVLCQHSLCPWVFFSILFHRSFRLSRAQTTASAWMKILSQIRLTLNPWILAYTVMPKFLQPFLRASTRGSTLHMRTLSILTPLTPLLSSPFWASYSFLKHTIAVSCHWAFEQAHPASLLGLAWHSFLCLPPWLVLPLSSHCTVIQSSAC